MAQWLVGAMVRLMAMTMGIGIVMIDASFEPDDPLAFDSVQLEMQQYGTTAASAGEE